MESAKNFRPALIKGIVPKGDPIPPSDKYSIGGLYSFTDADFQTREVIESSSWQDRSKSTQFYVVHEQRVGNTGRWNVKGSGKY